MKIIDRYIIRQILLATVFAVAALSSILVVGNILKRLLDLLVNHNIPFGYVLSFIGYLLPYCFIFTIPWGFLTAVLLIFGKLSGENELIALRTSGLSTIRICAPVFALALVFCGLCLWLNLTIAPRAHAKIKGIGVQLATENPIVLFGDEQSLTMFPDRRIYVGRKEGNVLHNIQVFEINSDHQPIRVVHAKRGELSTDPENKRILLHLFGARVAENDPPGDFNKIRDGIRIGESDAVIPLDKLYEMNQKRLGLETLPLSQLFGMKITDEHKKTALLTEINRRFSLSLAPFALALVGIPLAITAHRKESSIGFGLSLIVAFAYFVLIILADNFRGNPAAHPEFLIWISNVVFCGLGAGLFYRLTKK